MGSLLSLSKLRNSGIRLRGKPAFRGNRQEQCASVKPELEYVHQAGCPFGAKRAFLHESNAS